MNRTPIPFVAKVKPQEKSAPALPEPGTPGTPAPNTATPGTGLPPPVGGAPDKPHFDFYKILPGTEEPKVQGKAQDRTQDKATVDRAAAPPERLEKAPAKQEARSEAEASRTAKVTGKYWLQTGSFAGESEAEDLKACLAMAVVVRLSSVVVADKGTRYRVRLGPYDNTDELNRIKGELAKRGFDAAVIKY